MSTADPRYPEVHVPLTELDGNVFVLMGATCSALRRAGATDAEITEFTDEAKSGDYDHALQTIMAWVETS